MPRVLVVEDHLPTCRMMKVQLEREGYEVVLAHSVAEGQEALLGGVDGDFEVAVIDVDLPDGRGFELIDGLRRNGRSPTSVVMMTGDPSEESLQRSLSQGVFELLFKPFRFAELREALERAGEERRRWHQRLATLEELGSRARDASSWLADIARVERDGIGATEGLAGHQALTEREREILGLILRGLQNTEIAGQLRISANTVKYHVRNVLTKLGMESRTELFRRLLQQGD